MTILLASSSPRRNTLLEQAGHRVRVMVPPLPEPDWRRERLRPECHAEALAWFKAAAVLRQLGQADLHALGENGLVLGADTIVVVNDQIIGKPQDKEDARRILRNLSGTTHRVVTGVALAQPETLWRRIAHDATTVRMRPLSAQQIDAYLDTGMWEGKAGAYGIQDRDDPFVVAVEGSFSNVVGLPMELLATLLAEHANRASPVVAT